MKPRDRLWKRWHKRLLFIELGAIVLVLAISGTLAWLSYIRNLQTASLIEKPDIVIEGPNGEETDYLQLGDIDVTKGTGREYVFRIVTGKASSFRIQLAYTTNLPLSYSIYPASKTNTENYDNTVTHGTDTYYYGNTPIQGTARKNDKTFNATYDGTDRVQSAANPTYWQSELVNQQSTRAYYVLSVSWPNDLKNNKETDMIYLTVTDITG